MIRTALLGAIGVASLMVSALPAQAQDRYYETWRGQRDVPGDYRCDAFWDASKTDCGAAWRDQRSYSQRRGDGYVSGHRSGHDYRGDYRHSGYGQGYGYGSAYGYGRPYGGTTAYYGAYGRPDLVTGQGYGGSSYGSGYGGSSYGSGYGRDARRIDWCRRTYRSYDPSSGYYRAYSGRLVYCG